MSEIEMSCGIDYDHHEVIFIYWSWRLSTNENGIQKAIANAGKQIQEQIKKKRRAT